MSLTGLAFATKPNRGFQIFFALFRPAGMLTRPPLEPSTGDDRARPLQ
jgi:hypothetical protein